jgi:hypothetical protein
MSAYRHKLGKHDWYSGSLDELRTGHCVLPVFMCLIKKRPTLYWLLSVRALLCIIIHFWSACTKWKLWLTPTCATSHEIDPALVVWRSAHSKVGVQTVLNCFQFALDFWQIYLRAKNWFFLAPRQGLTRQMQSDIDYVSLATLSTALVQRRGR